MKVIFKKQQKEIEKKLKQLKEAEKHNEELIQELSNAEFKTLQLKDTCKMLSERNEELNKLNEQLEKKNKALTKEIKAYKENADTASIYEEYLYGAKKGN